MQEWQMELASQQTEEERARALAEVSAKALPDKLLTPDQYITRTCEDCDDDLNEFRMQRGCTKCVTCKQALEKRRKLFYQS